MCKLYYDDEIFNKHVPESELQRQLRERIAFHAQQAIQLSGVLNTRPPIAKLPPEILSEIFLTYATTVRNARLQIHTQSTQPDRDIHTTFYEWIRVTHVCKLWRDVALSCAKLWTWIAFEERLDSHFIDSLIERTLNLPLTYVHTINPDIPHCVSCIDEETFEDGFGAMAVMTQYLPRIRDLSIFIGLGGEFSDVIWEDIENSPAPVLETLHIETTGSARPAAIANRARATSESLSLSDRLFNAQTPRLCSLRLSGVAFRYTNPILAPSLRHLEIITPLYPDPDVDDGTAFRALIAHLLLLPSLETFVLHWWPYLNPQEVNSHQNAAISLPQLRSLDYTGPELAGHYLAKSIDRLGPDATLRYALGRHCALPKSTLGHLVGAAGGFLRTSSSSVHTVSYGAQKSRVVEGLGGNQLLTSAHLWAAPTPTTAASDAIAQPEQATQSPSSDLSRRAKRTVAASPSLTLDGVEKKLLAATLQRTDLSRVRTVQIAGFDEGDAWADALKNAHEVAVLRAVGMAAFGLPATLAAGIHKDIVYGASDRFMVLGLLEATVRRQIGGARGGEEDEATAAAWHWTRFWNAEERGEDDAVESMEALAHGPALFPKLEVIQLVDVDFAAPAPLQGMATERTVSASEKVLERFAKHGADYGFQVAAMLKALRARRAQGASDVVRIEFENCSCTDMAQLTPLMHVVQEVWWDGKCVN